MQELKLERDQLRLDLAGQSAVHALTGASVAPLNSDTLDELRGRRPQEREGEPHPPGVAGLRTGAPSDSGREQVCKVLSDNALREFPGPGGCTNEILKMCLDGVETLKLFSVSRWSP